MGSGQALRSDPQDDRTLRPLPPGALGANTPGPSRDPGCLLPPCVDGVCLLAPAPQPESGSAARGGGSGGPTRRPRHGQHRRKPRRCRTTTEGGRTPCNPPAGAEPPVSFTHVFPDSYKLVNVLRCPWPLERFWETDPKCFPSLLHFTLKADSSRMAEQWPECRHPTRKYLCPSLACLDCLLIPKQRNSGHLCLHQGLSVCF